MKQLNSSFRDPDGFIFHSDEHLYRKINSSYLDEYRHLMNSGLYNHLVDEGLLISHEEMPESRFPEHCDGLVIKPRLLNFISYPYEWCFSQLKLAAETTLKIQKIAFKYGMVLKDCSAFNIQFEGARPVFIDTLSFALYVKNKPWAPYKQFCQHFLAPLALMTYNDLRLNNFFKIHLDGIPLDMASSLLPMRSYLNSSLLTHIHLHAKSQAYFSDGKSKAPIQNFSSNALQGLMDSLESAIRKIKLPSTKTEWGNYYEDTNYLKDDFNFKHKTVQTFIETIKPETLWDLGANNGLFSRIGSDSRTLTVAFDIDPLAVEKNFSDVRKQNTINLLPLIMDLSNPSPSIGWAHSERSSLFQRGPADLVMALALIHHICIANNIPFDFVADYLSSICRYLIIEFVAKEDSNAQRLLLSREDIFVNYNRKNFEETFSQGFEILRSEKIGDSHRTLYLMKAR